MEQLGPRHGRGTASRPRGLAQVRASHLQSLSGAVWTVETGARTCISHETQVRYLQRALSIRATILLISEQKWMVPKSPKKVSKNANNCWICEPLNWNFRKFWEQCKTEKFPGRNFENLGVPREAVLYFEKFGKVVHSVIVYLNMLFHSPLEISEISDKNFWSNRKRPTNPCYFCSSRHLKE